MRSVMPARRFFQRWSPLFLVSSVGLFLELAVIRWLSSEVRLFSYFKSLPLLAAFLGLAIGFALVRKGRSYRSSFAPLFGVFSTAVLLVGRVASPRFLSYPSIDDEYLWATGAYSYWLALALFLATVLVFFLLTTFIFIPLGQATGEEMARNAPVPAYTVNIIGSLSGVWAFAWLSYLQTSPDIWFAVAFLGLGVYWSSRRTLSRTDLGIFVLVLLALVLFGRGTVWSPYHRLGSNYRPLSP